MNDVLRRARSVLLLMACCAFAAPPASGAALRFGVLPFQPAGRLLDQFGHLEDFLEQHGVGEIQLESAPDHVTFARRLTAGDYDLAFSAPHVALLATRSAGYLPLARTGHRVRPAFIVRAEDRPGSLAALAGLTIATPGAIALVTLMAEARLAGEPALAAQPAAFVHAPSHGAALGLVLRGLADVAVSIPLLLERMPKHQRDRLVVLAELEEVFSLVYIVAPRVRVAARVRVRALLMRFADSDQGLAFFAGNRHLRNVPLEAHELRVFEPLLPRLRERLRESTAATPRLP